MTAPVFRPTAARLKIPAPAVFEGSICGQTDPDLFFPPVGGSNRDAKKVCAVCPAEANCLQWALDNNEPSGVWGGMSTRERQQFKTAKRHAEPDIDHVAVERAMTGEPVPLTRAERLAAMRALMAQGRDDGQIANALHTTRRTLLRERKAAS
jgi:WhiB family redox-sensing transcriptional regulator